MNLPRVYTCSPSWTPLPPPSPYHHSGSSQCTSPRYPVSCIESRLAIHSLYDIIHVSMPFSQVIPLSPSPQSQFNHTQTTALSNLMKLSHALWATQDRQVMVERSDRMWSTGEGNAKPLQYSCLENPMNSMKRQNDRIPKEELPRSLGTQYAAGDQGRNNSRKNEGMEPKKNNTQLQMWLVIEARSDAVKSNIA